MMKHVFQALVLAALLAGCGSTTPPPSNSAIPDASATDVAAPSDAIVTDVVAPVDVPASPADVPASPVDVPASPVDVPASPVDVPASPVDVPASPVDVPARLVDVPASPVDVPASPVDVVTPPMDVVATRDVVTLDTPTPTLGCPNEIPIQFDTPVRGTTTTGWNTSLTAWAQQSNVACFPSTQADQFQGPFAVYSLDMPPRSDWNVVVVPDPGTNASIAAAYLTAAGSTGCAPTRGIGVVTCEAFNRGGPGAEERARLNSTTNGYKLTILVGAPTGGVRGGFTLRVVPHLTPVDAGVLPDATVASDASTTGGCPGETTIAFNTPARGSTSGPGWDANLTNWFARSDVACSPTTFSNVHNAPYQVFAIDMPPRSDWSIVLTPDPGVNANLAAVWQQRATETRCIPLLNLRQDAACEYSSRAGDGGEERVRLNAATVGYRVVILVNTPIGGTRGGFTLLARNYP